MRKKIKKHRTIKISLFDLNLQKDLLRRDIQEAESKIKAIDSVIKIAFKDEKEI